eukprot:jgi/Mesen1/9084/ME000058S08578
MEVLGRQLLRPVVTLLDSRIYDAYPAGARKGPGPHRAQTSRSHHAGVSNEGASMCQSALNAVPHSKKGHRSRIEASAILKGGARCDSRASESSAKLPRAALVMEGPTSTQKLSSNRIWRRDPSKSLDDEGVEGELESLLTRLRRAKNKEGRLAALREAGTGATRSYNFWYRLFDSLAASSKAELVLEAFDFMKEQEWYEPDTRWYSKLIAVLGRAKRPKLAWDVMLASQAAGLPLTADVLNPLMKSLAHGGHLEKAEGVLQRMRESDDARPSAMSYNIMVHAYSADHLFERAQSLVAEMRRVGVEPDVFTYTSLIAGYGKAGMWQEAEALAEDMKDAGCLPTVATYNTLLAGAARVKDVKKLEAFWARMRQENLAPNWKTYHALLEGYARVHRVEQMEAVFDEMREEGFRPTAEVFTTLAVGYGRLATLGKLETLKVSMQEQGVAPTTAFYSAVIDAYGMNGMYALMSETFQEMLESGYEVNIATVGSLLKAFARGNMLQEMDQVYHMLKGLVRLDRLAFKTMIQAHRAAHNLERVAELEEEMQKLLPARRRGAGPLAAAEVGGEGRRMRQRPTSK